MSPAAAALNGERSRDCRYATGSAPAGNGWERRFLPRDHLFRPLLADLKEPRFYAYMRRVRFRNASFAADGGRKITAGTTAMATDFGVWSARRSGSCNGYQIGVFAGTFSQFNLSSSSKNLMNADYQVGVPLSFRQGPYSARLRLYHQSSHLGDELLLQSPEIDRENLSFEALDLLGSLHGSQWRVYGGGAYRFRTDTGIARGSVQGGIEWRGAAGSDHTSWVAGADFQAMEEQDWGVTTSLAAGPEFAVPHSMQRIRFLAVYLNGYMPFGQFFGETRMENYGLGVQFDF